MTLNSVYTKNLTRSFALQESRGPHLDALLSKAYLRDVRGH